jgi:hypothetical protein
MDTLEHWRSKERPAALSGGAGTPPRRPPDSSHWQACLITCWAYKAPRGNDGAAKRVTPAAKALALAEQPVVTLNLRLLTVADVVAESIISVTKRPLWDLQGRQ